MAKRLLIIICICLGIIIGYISIKNNNISLKEKMTIEEAEEIIKNFTIGYGCNNIEEYTKNIVVTNKDVSNDRAFQVVQYLEFNSKEYNAITLENVKRKIARYYGDDYEFDPKKLTSKCSLYSYNLEDKIFYRTNEFCVNNCSNTETIYKVRDFDVDDGILIINVYVLFNSQSESTNYYKDYDRRNVVDDGDITEMTYSGDIYQFRFKKYGNNYQFISSKLM